MRSCCSDPYCGCGSRREQTYCLFIAVLEKSVARYVAAVEGKRGLRVLVDDAVEIMAIDRLERERGKGSADVRHRARRQRNKVRIAAHERQPFAIGRHRENIAGANDAASRRAPRPMQYRAAFEMAAAANERH